MRFKPSKNTLPALAKILPFLQKLANKLNRFSLFCGHFVAWLIIFMVLLVAYDVMMRYLFNAGSIALQELEWHIFAVLFLLGNAYTLQQDDHVRVDIFYRGRYSSKRYRAWVNLFGGLFFLLPFCLLIINSSLPFVSNAFVVAETSPDPGGLPYRWFLKAMIPLSFSLLLLQGLASMIDAAKQLLSKES